MGVDLRVRFPEGRIPEWPAVVERLATSGLVVQMRMIDGELAFPDDQPPEGWRELRVAASGAMVTVRRGKGEVIVVAWGNMDEQQRNLWQALADAFASAGGGIVDSAGGGCA